MTNITPITSEAYCLTIDETNTLFETWRRTGKLNHKGLMVTITRYLEAQYPHDDYSTMENTFVVIDRLMMMVVDDMSKLKAMNTVKYSKGLFFALNVGELFTHFNRPASENVCLSRTSHLIETVLMGDVFMDSAMTDDGEDILDFTDTLLEEKLIEFHESYGVEEFSHATSYRNLVDVINKDTRVSICDPDQNPMDITPTAQHNHRMLKENYSDLYTMTDTRNGRITMHTDSHPDRIISALLQLCEVWEELEYSHVLSEDELSETEETFANENIDGYIYDTISFSALDELDELSTDQMKEAAETFRPVANDMLNAYPWVDDSGEYACFRSNDDNEPISDKDVARAVVRHLNR